MENNLPEQTPPPQSHFHPKIWLPILIAVVAVAGYLAWANAQQQWPFATGDSPAVENVYEVFQKYVDAGKLERELAISWSGNIYSDVLIQFSDDEAKEDFSKSEVSGYTIVEIYSNLLIGYLKVADMKGALKLLEDERITRLSSDISLTGNQVSKDQTSAWKTYRNEEYGFEFKIPVDWQATLVKWSLIFTSPSEERKLKAKEQDCLKTLQNADVSICGALYHYREEMIFNELNPETPSLMKRDISKISIGANEWERYYDGDFINYELRQNDRIMSFSAHNELQLELILSTFKFTTQVETNKSREVLLGKAFTLKENESVKISGTEVYVKITKFYNSPCQGQCVWSGVGIGFEYTMGDEVLSGINRVQAFGYETTIVKTDHETYADLIVDKINK